MARALLRNSLATSAELRAGHPGA